ncbi:hypothetical protein BGX38DRAFT_1186209 [Terfezia claveryi]|nr:hypothetical protein BGX38DRAFT_1186209 [Terfezia claveryi]
MSARTLTRVANSSIYDLQYSLRLKLLSPVIISRAMSTTGPSDSRRSTGAGPTGQPLDPKEASQVRGHVTWIKGMAEEIVGKVSGAQSWTQSGQRDQQRAVQEMQLAKEERDKQAHYEKRSPTILNVEGTGEKVAGYMTGCAGMKERGDEKKQAAKAKTS